MEKRSNPFAKRTNPFQEVEEKIIEKTEVKEQAPVNAFPEAEPERYVPQHEVKVAPVAPRQPQTVPSNRYRSYAAMPQDNNREKYTSTMDKDLRKQIKFACVTRGIMFSQFVEEACAEKLDRERGR